MIGSRNALNFAYVLYLTLRSQKLPQAEIERHVRRWFVMSILTGRYSSSPESAFDLDIRQIYLQGISSYAEDTYRGVLSDAFWEAVLPQQLNTSVASSPSFRLYVAAQVKTGDKGFLSRDISIRDLVDYKSDVHHIFPRDFLKKYGHARTQYNQVANYVVAQSEINIAISNKEPSRYFSEIVEQVNGGKKCYGNIIDSDELRQNFRMNCIPDGMDQMGIDDYTLFLVKRRALMSKKIRAYFETL